MHYLADRKGSLVEAFKSYDPRVVFFYFLLAGLLLVLAGGLAYQQLFRTAFHHESERTQNQWRILVPGPRGNIYDRHGQLLVGNRPRFSVVLYLDELKLDLRREHFRIHKRFLAAGAKKRDFTYSQLEHLARVSVVQRTEPTTSTDSITRPARVQRQSTGIFRTTRSSVPGGGSVTLRRPRPFFETDVTSACQVSLFVRTSAGIAAL